MEDDRTLDRPGRQSTDAGDDEIDLMAWILVWWQRRWVILAITACLGLAGFAFGRIQAPTYEASARLVVSPPKTTLVGEAAPSVSIATFRAMLENQGLSAQIVREFQLDKRLGLSAAGFLGSHLEVATLRDTNILVLTVRMPENRLAADIANKLADLAIGQAQDLSQSETRRTRDYIKAQLDQSRSRLVEAENKLTDYQRQAQIEALKTDVEAALTERQDLLKLLVDIQSEKARLREAEAELKQREPVNTLTQTVESAPLLMDAAKNQGKEQGLAGMQVKNQYVNSVYETLDEQVARGRATLAGLERQRAELIEVRKLNSGQMALLNTLYARQSQLDSLKTERDLAKNIYVEVSTRYEQARIQVAGRTPQLQVIDYALPSERPSGPKVMRLTILAAMVGVLMASVAVLFLAAVQTASLRAKRPARRTGEPSAVA